MVEPVVELNFFTTERMSLFWEYVRTLLESIMPMVMIMAALGGLALLIGIIVAAVNKANGEEEEEHFERREY